MRYSLGWIIPGLLVTLLMPGCMNNSDAPEKAGAPPVTMHKPGFEQPNLSEFASKKGKKSAKPAPPAATQPPSQ